MVHTAAGSSPWIWVDGDPRRAAQFGLITGFFLGAGAFVTGALALAFRASLGTFHSAPISLPAVYLLLGVVLVPEYLLLS